MKLFLVSTLLLSLLIPCVQAGDLAYDIKWDNAVLSLYSGGEVFYSISAEITSPNPIYKCAVFDQYGRIWGEYDDRCRILQYVQGQMRCLVTIEIHQDFLVTRQLAGTHAPLLFYVVIIDEVSVYPEHIFPGMSLKCRDNLDSRALYRPRIDDTEYSLPLSSKYWSVTIHRWPESQ